MQSRVDNNLWQADPALKVQFFTLCLKSFCMIHWGHLSLTLVQKLLREFCKENDYFDELE
jgi:hypothetical protein